MVPEGLQTALNEIKNTLVQNNIVYAKELPTIMPTTPIGSLSQVLFADDEFFKNQFMPQLIQRIVLSSVYRRLYRNPLESLVDGEMPLGGISQEMMVNRVKSRQFDVNDFAGLLAKYPVDVKVIYNKINWNHQYAATITYDNIRDAFSSWNTLYNFTDEIAQAMYNECYIDHFNLTKYLISNAYRNNQVVMQTANAITDETSAKALIKSMRALYSQFKFASTAYNSWNLQGGYGYPVRTWTPPEDVVLFIRASDMATLNVDVWASAFHLDNADFLGRVYEVDNFDIINQDTGEVEFDGSNIIAAIGDRRWFDIKQQMRRFNQFFNANNETWQLYLHDVAGFNSRPFANMVLLVTQTPTVPVTGLDYNNTNAITMEAGTSEGLDINVTPVGATTPITYTITKDDEATTDITLKPSQNTRNVVLTATDDASGDYVLTASADNISATLTVTVNPAVQAQSIETQVANEVQKQVKAEVDKAVAQINTNLESAETTTSKSSSK